MIKQIIISFLSILFCSSISLAQNSKGSVSGIVVGKNSHLPIEYATVVLRDGATKKIITGVVTDSLGQFNIPDIKYGSYNVKCSYIGFSDYTSQVIKLSSQNSRIKLGKIALNDSGEMLNEVVVAGRRSTYVQSIDKKIFNVGSDISSASGSCSCHHSVSF